LTAVSKLKNHPKKAMKSPKRVGIQYIF